MIFEPSTDNESSIRYAKFKNMNWPILKDMYWGPDDPKCLASGEVVSLKSPWTDKWVINCDYDHIRENINGSKDN